MGVTDIVLWYGAFLIAIVFHEASHAWLAMLGGDRTAYVGGQVTLNPIPHIRREPFGTVILPLIGLLVFKFPIGYAHTPIDPLWAHRHPKRAALMSGAGPIANMLLVALAFVTLKLLLVSDHGVRSWDISWPEMLLVRPADEATSGAVYALCRIASVFVFLNLVLAILNLIPLPPLDGAGVLEGVFPRTLGSIYEYIRTQPMLQILIFVGVIYVLPDLFWPVYAQVASWLR